MEERGQENSQSVTGYHRTPWTTVYHTAFSWGLAATRTLQKGKVFDFYLQRGFLLKYLFEYSFEEKNYCVHLARKLFAIINTELQIIFYMIRNCHYINFPSITNVL